MRRSPPRTLHGAYVSALGNSPDAALLGEGHDWATCPVSTFSEAQLKHIYVIRNFT